MIWASERMRPVSTSLWCPAAVTPPPAHRRGGSGVHFANPWVDTHPAMWARLLKPSLVRMFPTWKSTVRSERTSLAAFCRFLIPAVTNAATFRPQCSSRVNQRVRTAQLGHRANRGWPSMPTRDHRGAKQCRVPAPVDTVDPRLRGSTPQRWSNHHPYASSSALCVVDANVPPGAGQTLPMQRPTRACGNRMQGEHAQPDVDLRRYGCA